MNIKRLIKRGTAISLLISTFSINGFGNIVNALNVDGHEVTKDVNGNEEVDKLNNTPNEIVILQTLKINAEDFVTYINQCIDHRMRLLSKEKTNRELDKQIQERFEKEEEEKHWVKDTFKLTAYCDCSICNGKWSGQPTASGTDYVEGRTIAVDPNVIPLGSKVIIDGTEYIAEDTGSAIKGNRIDMYMNNHNRTLNFGVKYVKVKYKIK